MNHSSPSPGTRWAPGWRSETCIWQGRRLKEQQEVAAAVIQRCYRKYKQVSTFSPEGAPHREPTPTAAGSTAVLLGP